MNRLAPLALAACLLAATPALAQRPGSNLVVTSLNCATNGSSGNPSAAPNGHISWPADNPLWEFDFSRPANSITADGTGLEIRDVYYDGVLVMKKGNVPVLNVEYLTGGGCGCFRDWQDNENEFLADGVYASPNGCFAESTPGVVMTSCERNQLPACDPDDDNDPDCGDDPAWGFSGVSVEDFGTELVLTSDTRAGWYRYRMKWHFYTDGRIWPEYSFSANSATCTDASHNHHAYWRFDFDLEGTPNNDVVREHGPRGVVVFEQEADRTWGNPTSGTYWSVSDADTGTRYDIIPSTEDLKLPIDAFSKTDALILKYKATEMDDGSVGCAIDYTSEQNNESIVDEDVVFWYRSSALHDGGNPWECDIVGPTLRPGGAIVSNEPGEAGDAAVTIDTAYPNPFTPYTTLRFRVAETQTVALVLHDALGREVRTLFDGQVVGGRSETVRVDGHDLPTGTYTVRLVGETAQATTRIVLVR